MRIASTLAVLVGLCYASPVFAQAKLTLGVLGGTNEKDKANVVFVVTNGKSAQTNWFVSITVGDVTYNSSKVATKIIGQTDGEISVVDNIKAGKYTVKLKVKLDDNTEISDEREVELPLVKEMGPPAFPCTPEPSTSCSSRFQAR